MLYRADSVAATCKRHNSALSTAWDSHFLLSSFPTFGLSIVKAVAHLDKNFPWIQEMRAAKRVAVVEQNPPVGNVDALDGERESLAELLAERQVKSRMRLKMISWDRRIAVGEARGVINV